MLLACLQEDNVKGGRCFLSFFLNFILFCPIKFLFRNNIIVSTAVHSAVSTDYVTYQYKRVWNSCGYMCVCVCDLFHRLVPFLV